VRFHREDRHRGNHAVLFGQGFFGLDASPVGKATVQYEGTGDTGGSQFEVLLVNVHDPA
jgi:hypothetical protein